MPTIAGRRSSPISGGKKLPTDLIKDSTPQKRTLRSNSALKDSPISSTPSPMQVSTMKLKSPRRCINDSPNSPAKGIVEKDGDKMEKTIKSPVKKRLLDNLLDKPVWNPRDIKQMSTAKEALHVSRAPPNVVCREDEQNKVLEFCKRCVEQEKAGSLYICGCPGTGKSLSMDRVKESLVSWIKEAECPSVDILSINCTSLTNTSEIFSKILGKDQAPKKANGSTSPLKHLQNLYSQKQHSSGTKMLLIVADELDYLITKDRAVLHDLFMLTTYPFSRCILIGVANAIDLADRFLPKLQSMNCKPLVMTFRAYSKDQIVKILQQRLTGLPFTLFQPQALELCARRVSAASGDMRKALWVCRSAIEILEAELKESINNPVLSSMEQTFSDQQAVEAHNILAKQENHIVRVDHVATALSKAYKSPVVDTIQSLPQHQQFILCSAVKLFRGSKKDSNVGELNKFYSDVCKSTSIPPVGVVELSSMCRVLADQGLIKLGQSREDKLKRVALKVDEADIVFALQGIRFFRNCLQ